MTVQLPSSFSFRNCSIAAKYTVYKVCQYCVALAQDAIDHDDQAST